MRAPNKTPAFALEWAVSSVWGKTNDRIATQRYVGGSNSRDSDRVARERLFFGARIRLRITFNYPVLWVRVKGRG